MHRHRCKIYPDGTMRFITADFLAPLHQQTESLKIQRVSHVEPNEKGEWVADLSPVGGPKSPAFVLRAEALAWEEAYVNAHVL